MSEWLEGTDWLGLLGAVAVGWLLGRWWAGSMIWHYVKSKRPDISGGFRTGLHLGDGMYYLVTGQEYRWLLEQDYRLREATDGTGKAGDDSERG